MNGKGRKRQVWCALIGGIWTEACPVRFWFDKPHRIGSEND